MFDHPDIEVQDIKDVPLSRDCYLVDVSYMSNFEQELTKTLARKNGDIYKDILVNYAALEYVNDEDDIADFLWYPNAFERFHPVSIHIPKNAIKVCITCDKYDIKPYIFVDSNVIHRLHSYKHSSFVLIDAIGVKKAIRHNDLKEDELILLRNRIDDIAKKYQDMSFISYADSLIIKHNWGVGMLTSAGNHYQPEKLLIVVNKIKKIYKDILGLEIYSIFTQGSNEHYGREELLHISDTRNHICLNSLGIPFAETISIEESIRNKKLEYSVYMDEHYYRSLNMRFDFKKDERPKYLYNAKMRNVDSYYFCLELDELLANIEDE